MENKIEVNKDDNIKLSTKDVIYKVNKGIAHSFYCRYFNRGL